MANEIGEKKYLDQQGLVHLKGILKTALNKKVDKVEGKGLSTNDLTNDLKQTYDNTVTAVEGIISTGGEANVINEIKVNNVKQEPDNKVVNITMPTKVSDLTNDGDGTTGSKFATESYVSTNGGKIDKITVNSTEQTITNKTVNIDLSGYVTKETGKSLISDTEITRLASINNYDDTALAGRVTTIEGKESGWDAKQSALTTDQIAATNSGITSDKVSAYDGYATGKQDTLTFNTAYNAESNKVATMSDINTALSSAMNYKGTKNTYAELPASGNHTGDVWNITTADSTNNIKAGDNVAWNGSSWDVLSGVVDLSGYVQKDGTKVLSTNDFTATYKTALDNLDTNLGNKANTADVLNKTNDVITNAEIDTIFNSATDGTDAIFN